MTEAGQTDPVVVLQRWQEAGAVWRVIGRRTGSATVSLRTCAGGEEVDRFTSTDRRLLAFLTDRSGSDD